MYETYTVMPQNAGTGIPQFTTTEEANFIARESVDVKWWFDGRGRLIEASPNLRFVEWRSRVALNGVAQPKLVSPSEPLGTYYGITPGTTTRVEYRFGLDAANNPISGFNNKLMSGVSATTLLPPTGDVTLAILLRVVQPASNSIILGTQATDTQFALTATNTGTPGSFGVRVYSDFSGTLVGSTTPIDANPLLLVIKMSRANNTVEMLRDGTSIRTPTAFTLPSYANSNINFGTITAGSTTTANSGLGIQSACCINSIDGVSLALFNTMLAARPN